MTILESLGYSQPNQFVEACKWEVARELARSKLAPNHNQMSVSDRLEAWHRATHECIPDASKRIENMKGLELLTLIAEMLNKGS